MSPFDRENTAGSDGRVRRRLRIFFGLSAGVGAAFALATSTLSYFTSESTALPSCAGRDVVQGFRVDTVDLIALPLFSLAFLAFLVVMAKGRQAVEDVEEDDLTVFEFSSLRISHGMFVVGSVCLGLVAFNAAMTGISFNRYHQISRYCQSTAGGGSDERR